MVFLEWSLFVFCWFNSLFMFVLVRNLKDRGFMIDTGSFCCFFLYDHRAKRLGSGARTGGDSLRFAGRKDGLSCALFNWFWVKENEAHSLGRCCLLPFKIVFDPGSLHPMLGGEFRFLTPKVK